MKTIIITTLLLITSLTYAAEVNLNINYNVDGVPFELDKEYVNKDGIKYKISRFQYYMCEFQLDDTQLDGTYILANASMPSYPLGNINVSSIDNINISFGVEEEENIGKDPNRYSMFHPLAPKNPSMHWGWSAGYRFWAIEGFSDPDGDGEYDKSFQFHILGDESFRTLSLPVNSTEENGTIDINLSFNIQEILAPVDMTTFGVHHDFYNNSQPIRDLINNFAESEVVTSEAITSVAVY
ncbi:MAG: MbnP family protein [Chlorobiota bacterium]